MTNIDKTDIICVSGIAANSDDQLVGENRQFAEVEGSTSGEEFEGDIVDFIKLNDLVRDLIIQGVVNPSIGVAMEPVNNGC